MSGIALLWQVYVLLPLVFALDLVAFHLTGDHPLAARWWWGRGGRGLRDVRAGVVDAQGRDDPAPRR